MPSFPSPGWFDLPVFRLARWQKMPHVPVGSSASEAPTWTNTPVPLQTDDDSSQWNTGRKNTSYFLIWPWEIFREILLTFSLPISLGKGRGPQVLEEGMAIRQKGAWVPEWKAAIEQTPFPPNSHRQIQNKLYYTKPLKQRDRLLWRLTYGEPSQTALLFSKLRIGFQNCHIHTHLQP